MMLNYDYPMYRPPSEAKSLIFQVTLGCSFNQCSFCDMYRSKEYSERPWEEIKMEIDMMAKQMPEKPSIFLADADELRKMYEVGLKMMYIGIESGSDIVLKKVTKGATSQTIIRACRKAIDAGFTISCMVILGLGGKTYTKEHIRGTAKVLSAVSPQYSAALTLIIEPGVKDEFMTKFGEPFIPVSDSEALDELEDLVSKIETKEEIIFRANHGSNAYTIKGTFPQDKQSMLEKISWMKQHPEAVRAEGLRGF